MARKDWKNIIPQPDWVEDIKHKKGNTQDIINVLVDALKYNNYQAAREMKEVSAELRSASDYDTLYNVWSFVKTNIKYKIDEPGAEKIKNPALLFHYGTGDCKSFSLMIAAILMNYPQIGFSFRFTGYDRNGDYGHVYIIARINSIKRDIIIDATYSEFDKEAPYIKKKDIQMTQISHLHGIPNINRKARPSIAEAFSDGPRQAVTTPIDISKYSQGELNLQLNKAKLKMYSGYYGDINGQYSTAISLIDNAIKNGLHNFNPNNVGFFYSQFNGIIQAIINAKSNHITELTNIQEAKQEAGISGGNVKFPISPEELGICVKNLTKSTNSNFFSQHDWVEWGGNRYRLTDSLNECIRVGILKTWAKKNIFETVNFKKGSHSLLYEFIDSSNSNQLNGRGAAKEVIHKSYVESFARISGLSTDNVRLYVENGIGYTSALSKLEHISPAYNIEVLSNGLQYKAQPSINFIDPATVTIVVSIISAAITSFLGAIKDLGPTNESNLNNYTKGLLGDSSKADIDDFEKRLSSAETLGTYLPIGLAIAAGGYLVFNSKK